MLHLSTERLAALADELPTAGEQQHLDGCPACAQEVAAHRGVLAMAAAERDLMGIPLTRWETLSVRLRKEGLVSKPLTPSAGSTAGARRLNGRALARFAAAVILVAGGAVAGRASAGAPLLPGGLQGTAHERENAAVPFAEWQVPATFASLDQARRYRDLFAAAYHNAVTFLAEHDSIGRGTPAVMRARLTALDNVSRTMGEALRDAPHDPVINDFYINSFGQREATLRLLNAALPQGVRMNGF